MNRRQANSCFLFLALCLIGRSILLGADTLELLAGGAKAQVDILATEAQLLEPFAAEFDEKGNLWIIEMARGNRLLRVQRNGILEHIAGKKGPRGDALSETRVEGARLEATFHGPHNLAILNPAEILISDTWNGRIRTWQEDTQIISSLNGYEVTKAEARSKGPYCISLSPDKSTLYIADLQRIYARDMQSGTTTIVAGNGKKGVPVDGDLAIHSPLVDPRAVAADSKGNIYILERNGNALRVVSPSGVIETVVNRSGKKGMGLEEGNAIEIGLNGPKHLCIDIDDSVIIADAESHTIRRYDPNTRTISRLVGTGKLGKGNINLPPRECMLARPHGVSIHLTTGNLVITDSYNDRVLLLRRD